MIFKIILFGQVKNLFSRLLEENAKNSNEQLNKLRSESANAISLLESKLQPVLMIKN